MELKDFYHHIWDQHPQKYIMRWARAQIIHYENICSKVLAWSFCRIWLNKLIYVVKGRHFSSNSNCRYTPWHWSERSYPWCSLVTPLRYPVHGLIVANSISAWRTFSWMMSQNFMHNVKLWDQKFNEIVMINDWYILKHFSQVMTKIR